MFWNRGRKVDEERIRAEKDKEIARLKATIAEVVQENLETKKRLETIAEERADMSSLFLRYLQNGDKHS
jgi:hypothetical protein